MSLDRLELLEVRLGSGKVYLVPRALLENLVQALPVSAPQLIVSATATDGPLDPSDLPSKCLGPAAPLILLESGPACRSPLCEP